MRKGISRKVNTNDVAGIYAVCLVFLWKQMEDDIEKMLRQVC